VKHYFHFLFTAALLLGSFILYNNQKNEYQGQLQDKPQNEYSVLQAELPNRGINEILFQVSRNSPGMVSRFPSNRIRESISLDLCKYQVGLKRQVQIHLELKPQIARLSALYLLHRPGYDDPPAS